MILDWMVIGAGPAGIAAVGKLLDQGISPKKIGWMDPHFSAGDLGSKWKEVPSNTQVALFLSFLNDCESFKFRNRSVTFHIDKLDPRENCLLKHAAEPLIWITTHFREKINSFQEVAVGLNLSKGRYEIKTKAQVVFAKNVILAIGSDPKNLTYPGLETIPIEVALNPEKLSKHISSEDTVALFGSSHSAILALANVIDNNPKAVINFYRTPHKYAVYLDDWILYDDTGLKGFAAAWAKQHLDHSMPSILKRVLTSDHTFDESLALCNKAIYAVGFERRKLPVLEQYEKLDYDNRTGIIAPGLFGLGIAFPEAKFDPLGHLDYRVGLWKFMQYLNAILPIWNRYTN